MKNTKFTSATFAAVSIVLLLGMISVRARGGTIPIGEASNYALLYTGNGGHNLQITNVSIQGSVGVGGTGKVQDSGPSSIIASGGPNVGALNFAAANTGQFSNNNANNVISGGVNYSVAGVTSALNTVSALNTSLGGIGTSIAISGNQTINASTGLLQTIGGVSYRMFNVTSYSSGDGKMLNIIGDGATPVVFNFAFNSNVNLGGDVTLSGLVEDQVLWNFTSVGKNVSLNNNASSYSDRFFQGIILAPNDGLAMTNANLKGRIFGGDSTDFQYVSGSLINAPPAVPLPPSSLAGMVMLGSLGLVRLARKNFGQSHTI